MGFLRRGLIIATLKDCGTSAVNIESVMVGLYGTQMHRCWNAGNPNHLPHLHQPALSPEVSGLPAHPIFLPWRLRTPLWVGKGAGAHCGRWVAGQGNGVRRGAGTGRSTGYCCPPPHCAGRIHFFGSDGALVESLLHLFFKRAISKEGYADTVNFLVNILFEYTLISNLGWAIK